MGIEFEDVASNSVKRRVFVPAQRCWDPGQRRWFMDAGAAIDEATEVENALFGKKPDQLGDITVGVKIEGEAAKLLEPKDRALKLLWLSKLPKYISH